MFSLHILQAEEGDCVLLEYGRQANPHSALVDGGPSGTYENHIRPVLEEAGSRNGTLDVVVVSHIDSDHIAGVVSLFDAWLAARRADRSLGSMVAGALWHNAPRDAAGGPVEGRLRDVLGHARFGAGGLPSADMVLASIAEGQSLKFKALNAHVSRNERFKDRIICVDTAVPQSLAESVSIRVVGPTRTQLDRLFAEWDEWLTKNEAALAVGQPDRIAQAARADQSVPNLSSIVLLVEAEGRTVLLTGDARGDHIIEGLQQIGALSVGGTIKIDALKVPHHGSRQNTDRDFFDRVIADHYVITGNGKSGNPPAATFETIAESARDSGRRVNFWVTTRTSAVNEFCRRFPPQTWPYEVHVLPADRHSMTIELARSTA